MRFLVVGLGSMGKRRVRNLQALGHRQLGGFDLREDRRSEAAAKYSIETFDSFEEALDRFRPAALVISTGPGHHMDYAFRAAERGIHCFIEASVVDADRIDELWHCTKDDRLVMAPSCTMRYFPGPRLVKQLVREERIGKPLALTYHTGQYLPDWHPWEDIRDFYVSKRETGGCREIVPFELTWLDDVFGEPEPLACLRDKVTDMPADIDDVYCCLLRYPTGMLANLTVEVVSRPRATREFRLLGSEGQLVMSGDENVVRHILAGEADWSHTSIGAGTKEEGYINPEEPYVAEMGDFVRAVETRNPKAFPNTLADDARVLRVLDALDVLSARTR